MSLVDLSGKLQAEACYGMLCALAHALQHDTARETPVMHTSDQQHKSLEAARLCFSAATHAVLDDNTSAQLGSVVSYNDAAFASLRSLFGITMEVVRVPCLCVLSASQWLQTD